MADLRNLSDTDDSAVEDLISQAQDLCVLHQLSKINCASFSDSLLPSDLETRFLKLKSKSAPSNPKYSDPLGKTTSLNDAQEKESQSKDMEKTPNREEKSRDDSLLFSPSDSSHSWIENFISTPSKHESGKRISSFNSKLKTGSFSSHLGSSDTSMDSSSPPRKTGCFWCSPKKDSGKKKKKSWNDELMSDLNIFSWKEQEKIMRKAMKEEEMISREAEKIVKWARQASDRMNFHGIEDEISDEDDDKTKI